MRYIVQHRRGSAAQWAEKNTIIPKEGELVIEIDEVNSLHKLKIGDGVHTYAELAYLMAGDEIVTQVLAQALPRVITITLDVDKWTEVTCATDPNLGYYGQTITLDGITAHSRLDLQPNADMLAELKQLGVAFVTENKGGIITVYSVGNMPLKSYTMQATIVETEIVVEDDKIVGIPVGASNAISVITRADLDEDLGSIIDKADDAIIAAGGTVLFENDSCTASEYEAGTYGGTAYPYDTSIYESVYDNNTRDFCLEINGKVFKVDGGVRIDDIDGGTSSGDFYSADGEMVNVIFHNSSISFATNANIEQPFTVKLYRAGEYTPTSEQQINYDYLPFITSNALFEKTNFEVTRDEGYYPPHAFYPLDLTDYFNGTKDYTNLRLQADNLVFNCVSNIEDSDDTCPYVLSFKITVPHDDGTDIWDVTTYAYVAGASLTSFGIAFENFLFDAAYLSEPLGRIKLYDSSIGGSYKVDPDYLPSTLPNPNKLTFTGVVTGEYDGSEAMTLNIPVISGEDGVSPTIDVSTITGGHRLTITDVNGTETVDVMDGKDGADGRGIMLIQKTATSGLYDTYEIKYTDGTTSTFSVKNGSDGTSVTVESVRQSAMDGGTNYVNFSDGTTLTVMNGSKGKTAYEYAQEGGYAGSEEEFTAKLASDIPTKVSELTNDSGFITGYTETDPTVPAWAKASTKPSYTKSEVGLSNVDNVKQYSASNPPPYPVTKVNNKTGAVTLSASDVGADASGTASSAVSSHNTNTSAHADIREQIDQLSSEIADITPVKGEDYFDGYTPARGIDYWTEEDQNKISGDISAEIASQIESLSTLPYGGSKEWLENNGDKSQLYQINGYIWAYIESNGWTQSGAQFLVVSNENDMTNKGGTEYLLRSGDEGTVYQYTEASGDADTPVYDSLPTTATEGDIVAVGGRKYKATVTTKEVPNCTNLADPTSADWWTDSRIGSDGTPRDCPGGAVTNMIKLAKGDTVRVKGLDLVNRINNVNSHYCGVYNASKAVASVTALSSMAAEGLSDITATATGGQFTYNYDGTKYIRFAGALNSTAADVIITINEEITYKTETAVTWEDIGEYIPPVEAGWNATDETYSVIDSLSVSASNGDSAVYSVDGYVYSYISGSAWAQTSKYNAPTLAIDSELSSSSTNAVQNKVIDAAINEVKAKTNANAESILTLQNKIESIGGGTSSETTTIPSYWKSEVASKTEVVKALQTAGGKNCVSFAWTSDTHIPDNDGGRTTDLGKVMAQMLDNCEIPFAMISGDINTRASYPTEDGLLTAQASMPVHLAPLWGTDRLLMALGNHDGCYGDSSGYYRKQHNPERMWQTFFRGQALDFRRVFSDDGLYFYVDNTVQKTRFIILNSHFGGNYSVDANGWAVNNRFGTSCYGQEQLNWLANTALDMPEGYSAIITAHVPLNVTYTVDKAQLIGIVNAYCNKTTYSGAYNGVAGWTSSNISVDFTNAVGEIIAIFAGHVHGDSVDTTTLACPIITILSAGAPANDAYKETAPTRTAGTATETSFDVVTINKATRTIYCTRIGAGPNREIRY